MSRGENPGESGVPKRQRPAVSASETGDAKASDGGMANSGTISRSSIRNMAVDRQYALFWEWAVGWSILPVAVGSITAAAVIRRPEGRTGQFVLPYTLMAAAILTAVLLATIAGEWGGRERAMERPVRGEGGPSLRARTVMAIACLAAAMSGLLWVEYLREHGEVDVTRFKLEDNSEVGQEKQATLILIGKPERDYLRFTVSIKDKNPNAGFCAPGTKIEAALEEELPQGANKSLTNGDTAELKLDGRKEIRVQLTVSTIPGCHVEVGVTDVSVYG